jgi:hypothetical protein
MGLFDETGIFKLAHDVPDRCRTPTGGMFEAI